MSSKRHTRKALHHGARKVVYEGPASDTLVLYFKDEDPESPGKGVINNRCSEILMERLGEMGIDTHLIRRINMREQLVRSVSPLPFRFVINQVAIGSFAQKFSIGEGACFQDPIIELLYQTASGESILVSPQHVIGLGWLPEEELERLFTIVQRMSDFLAGYFSARNLKMVRCSLLFGQTADDSFVLMDEISPDTCTWVEMDTGLYLDAKTKELPVHLIVSERLALFPKEEVLEEPSHAA